jgi:hypothetical protein
MIIYNEFGQFVLSIVLDSSVIGAVTLRLSYFVYQLLKLKPFIIIGFAEYFPVPYFDWFEKNIRYVEMGMIVLILVNSLNIFYFDFFGQVFLTFQNSVEKMTGYFLIFLLIVFSYSMAATIMYGANLTGIYLFIPRVF